MQSRRMGKSSIRFVNPPSFLSFAAVTGKKEGEGPLGACFDLVCDDAFFGQSTWEKAESRMVEHAAALALEKAGLEPEAIELSFSGDLLNQCIGSTYGLRDFGMPSLGLYGACSTMAEGLLLSAMSIDGGFASRVMAEASSHFCTAERQYRYPLEYGSVRAPSAQWTVTGCGAAVLSDEGPGPYITGACVGRIVDAGVTDAGNMGAAMAPAAYQTLRDYFEDSASSPSDYDLILTGDLGSIGHAIVCDFFECDGVNIAPNYRDCGMLIYSAENQDVHAGGSGCGCSAAVLTGHILPEMRRGRWRRVLFAGTGSLQSPVSCQQGESMPGICHLVCIESLNGGRDGTVV